MTRSYFLEDENAFASPLITCIWSAYGEIATFSCGMTVQADNSAYVCGTEGWLETGWPWKPQPGKGAYTLARATLGQMVIRIALQCNEADAYLIMDQDNPAPRLLSRPGEGIYNDTAGTIEGNSPFQVVWLSDEIRDSYLEKARALADQRGGQWPGPIVFEGNAAADPSENRLLAAGLEAPTPTSSAGVCAWLGAAVAIKDPTEALFRAQSGSNLLIVGQQDELALGMLSIAVIGLAAQLRQSTTHHSPTHPLTHPPNNPPTHNHHQIIHISTTYTEFILHNVRVFISMYIV